LKGFGKTLVRAHSTYHIIDGVLLTHYISKFLAKPEIFAGIEIILRHFSFYLESFVTSTIMASLKILLDLSDHDVHKSGF
jgi:hypothetical protein